MARFGDDHHYVEFAATQDLTSMRVALVSPGLEAALAIPTVDVGGGEDRTLVDYFARIEKRWRGWQGEEVWNSGEGHLSLRATHIGSRVQLLALFRSYGLRDEQPWSITLEVSLAAGEDLSAFVSDLRAEVGAQTAPP